MTSATITERRTSLQPAAKSRRVRTGCLTCRARHLKCDEAAPVCLNCRKSNRVCERGLKLNFLDVRVHEDRYIIPVARHSVSFQDESRQIASEYHGGLKRYPEEDHYNTQLRLKVEGDALQRAVKLRINSRSSFRKERPNPIKMESHERPTSCLEVPPSLGSSYTCKPHLQGRALSTYWHVDSTGSGYQTPPSTAFQAHSAFDLTLPEDLAMVKAEVASRNNYTSEESSAASIMPQVTNGTPSRGSGSWENSPWDRLDSPASCEGSRIGERYFLGSPDEIHYLQVFVEQVGVWMDSFDPLRHFSQITPYHALKSPMLLNACLACGVMHQAGTSQKLSTKAHAYYQTASTNLLRSLSNPDRNMAECATATVILHVYETMADIPATHMDHIAGARAQIRECGWNAATGGIGSACFWLNIEMEVMNCLAMNWTTTWSPDEWGVDSRICDEEDTHSIGKEETWVHKIFYIVARLANFRATRPCFTELDLTEENKKRAMRRAEWDELKNMCERWDHSCPRTMHAIGYQEDGMSSSTSCFPNIWVINRTAIVSRLFYQIAYYLLFETIPPEYRDPSPDSKGSFKQLYHARQACGIIAHTRDNGVSSLAMHSLAIVGPSLTESREQEEVLNIFATLRRRSGLQLHRLEKNLKETWSRQRSTALHVGGQLVQTVTQVQMANERQFTIDPGANPLWCADFGMPGAPYRNWYVPPNRTTIYSPPLL